MQSAVRHHYTQLYMHGPPQDGTNRCHQGPYRWRHAGLTEIQKLLKDAAADGEYVPVLRTGLEGPIR